MTLKVVTKALKKGMIKFGERMEDERMPIDRKFYKHNVSIHCISHYLHSSGSKFRKKMKTTSFSGCFRKPNFKRVEFCLFRPITNEFLVSQIVSCEWLSERIEFELETNLFYFYLCKAVFSVRIRSISQSETEKIRE